MLKTFYIQLDLENRIRDIIEIPHDGYIEVQLNTPLPYRIMEGAYKLVNRQVIYIPEWDTNELVNKVSILEDENKTLNTKLDTVKYTHSDLILDMDFRIMDIEDTIGIAPNNIKLFNRIGEGNMNSTFMLVLDKIEMGNYKNKEEIESICDRYLARERINGEEYDMLMKSLDKKEENNTVIS